MLQPSRTKFRCDRKGRSGIIRNITHRGVELEYGVAGLKATEPGRITAGQIESCRRVMIRTIKKLKGKLIIRIFPHKPVSKKPAEVRMGGGKGGPEFWVSIIKPGRMLFEICSVEKPIAIELLKAVQYKLPVSTKVIMREE